MYTWSITIEVQLDAVPYETRYSALIEALHNHCMDNAPKMVEQCWAAVTSGDVLQTQYVTLCKKATSKNVLFPGDNH